MFIGRKNTVVQQAGAIVYKIDRGIHVLLIRAKKNPDHRVVPKGHIERGETASEAAARELLEEAGVRGEKVGFAGTGEFVRKKKIYSVSYFIFKFIEKINNGEPGRSPEWYTIEDAVHMLSFKEMKNIMADCSEIIIRSEHEMP